MQQHHHQQQQQHPQPQHQQKQHLADAVNASGDSLNPMSLLQLPIITDIRQEDNVAEVIVPKTEPTTSLASEHSASDSNSLTPDNQDVADASEKADDANTEGATAPVLWGCKQCDFR